MNHIKRSQDVTVRTQNQVLLPALPEQCAELTKVCKALKSYSAYFSPWHRRDVNLDVAAAKRVLTQASSLLPAWNAASQPASDDQIGTAVATLLLSFTNLGRDMDHFARSLTADVAELEPTLFELDRACHQVRTKREFVSIAAVIAALKSARAKARDMDDEFRQLPEIQQAVTQYEAELPRLLEARKAAQARERAADLKRAREKWKLHPLFAVHWTSYELELLGKSHDDVQQRRDKARRDLAKKHTS